MAKHEELDQYAETSTGYEVSAISVEISVTPTELSLRRAIHKIAWQRMHGRNDAMNPYCDPPPSLGTPADSGEHARS